MNAVWIRKVFLGAALPALLAPCLTIPTAVAQTMPTVVAHTLPTYDKVDLACTGNGECAGSISFGAGYVLNSITCLTSSGAYYYGYADISAGGMYSRKYIYPKYSSPRYYWLQSSRYITIDEEINQPATQVDIHMNVNPVYAGWAQCYSTGSRVPEWNRHPYYYGHYYGPASPGTEKQLNWQELARIQGQMR